ncbi:P-type conjugative transfer protein TrbJ [Campylobacter sp. RM12640]|uniref:P-type conjugative transfer protein TrbJ n=1 Tax=unclassified Campylobacter TaxID=2593542 RepID=UPI001D79D5A8|nr:P-type conjugative transfer protein TrbJ [Campylobacter sp. RM12642]MBZ7982457.1 P-type conjugative transfer protein TrbJ [Campylobacter sp. RM12640]MBZ7989962.1 P-type conjugative transfer protein TrbJ [Campylobacter sp. RM12635]MBZ8008225.1 P-type conjugative transfer protein TrbJ [Campylobacter sp. RM9334]
MKISKILCIFLFGANICASGIPTVDIAAIAGQLKDYYTQIEQIQQLTTQINQYKNMIEMSKTNLKNLTKFDWQTLDSILYQTNNIINSAGALSYNTKNLTDKFDNLYKNPETIRQDYINSTDEQRILNSYNYNKRINDNLRITSRATLEKMKANNKQLEEESKTIKKLKERSEGAKGQLQATQAANDLLAYQIDELRKLRVAMMDQMAMLSNVIAAQSMKEQAMEEKLHEFYKDANKAGRTQKIIPSVTKWK